MSNLPLLFPSIGVLVGPLGRAGASRPFVPPPAAQTANQAAALRPMHSKTPVGVALKRFTPQSLNAHCQQRQAGTQSVLSGLRPLCWTEVTLQHEVWAVFLDWLTDWLKRVFTFHDRTGTFLLPAGHHLLSNHVMAGLMWCFMSCYCLNASFVTEKLSLYRHQTKMTALYYYFIAAM